MSALLSSFWYHIAEAKQEQCKSAAKAANQFALDVAYEQALAAHTFIPWTRAQQPIYDTHDQRSNKLLTKHSYNSIEQSRAVVSHCKRSHS
jgi:hypothetical protein